MTNKDEVFALVKKWVVLQSVHMIPNSLAQHFYIKHHEVCFRSFSDIFHPQERRSHNIVLDSWSTGLITKSKYLPFSFLLIRSYIYSSFSLYVTGVCRYPGITTSRKCRQHISFGSTLCLWLLIPSCADEVSWKAGICELDRLER